MDDVAAWLQRIGMLEQPGGAQAAGTGSAESGTGSDPETEPVPESPMEPESDRTNTGSEADGLPYVTEGFLRLEPEFFRPDIGSNALEI